MSSPFSPVAAVTKHKVQTYYQRTITDKELAENWAKHYLSGLKLSFDDPILEYGCGRGRNIGMLTQLGYKVVGQEVQGDEWWSHFSNSCFQLVPASLPKLPWKNEVFGLILNIMVMGHLDDINLKNHFKQISNILKKGGYWIILEANSTGYSAKNPRKHYGRLHSLEKIKLLAKTNGFKEIDCSFEGFYAPFFPRAFNFFRRQCRFGSFDMYDYGSKIEKITPEKKRGLWLLRLKKV